MVRAVQDKGEGRGKGLNNLLRLPGMKFNGSLRYAGWFDNRSARPPIKSSGGVPPCGTHLFLTFFAVYNFLHSSHFTHALPMVGSFSFFILF